jgi:transposase
VRSLGSPQQRAPEHQRHAPDDPTAGIHPKKRTLGATERNHAKRQIWHRIVRNLAARRLRFVDESGANVTLARRYGWAPRNERCQGAVPRKYGHNLTLIASLSLDGLEAPMLLEGAVDSLAFERYVAEVLVPTLRRGELVILDNLAVHKQPAIRAMIEAAGCRLLFLPSYSPDFSPIELAFAKIKAYLRRVGARTQEALEEAIAVAIDLITAADASGYFRHNGYVN